MSYRDPNTGVPVGQVVDVCQKVIVESQGAPVEVAVQYAKIDNAAGAGQTQIVAAVAGQKIVVLAARVIAHAADTFKFQDHNTDLQGFQDLAALGSAYDLPFMKHGWMQTSVGNELNINSSGAVQLSGYVVFIQYAP